MKKKERENKLTKIKKSHFKDILRVVFFVFTFSLVYPQITEITEENTNEQLTENESARTQSKDILGTKEEVDQGKKGTEEDYDVSATLPDVVVTGHKTSIHHYNTYTETKIDSEAIENQPYDHITDVIERKPGLSSVGNGYHRASVIRGMSRRRTLILVNGERLDTLRNAGVSASHISPFGVKEINVLRGPFSTIYGSDAMGGIINIITKSPELSHEKMYDVNVNSAYMSNGNGVNTGMAAAVGISDLYYSFAGSFRDRSDIEYEGGEVSNTGYRDFNVSNSIFWRITSAQSIKINASYAKGTDIGKPTGDLNREGYHPEELNQSLTLKYLNQFNGSVFKDFQLRLSLKTMDMSVQMDVQNYENGVSVDNRKDTSIGPMYDYQIYQSMQLGSFVGLLIGANGYYQEDISIIGRKKVYDIESGFFKKDSGEVSFVSEGEAINAGIFTELTVDVTKNFNIDSGIRYDFFEIGAAWQTEESGTLGIDSTVHPKEKHEFSASSYHLGGAYRFIDYTSFFANAGSAFRAPSIKELFYSGSTPNGYNISNPNLKPEKSLNIEGGLRYLNKKISASVSVFQNTIQDYITIDWNEDHSIGSFENIGKAQIRGVEADLDIPLVYGFSYYLGSAYMRGRDIKLDEPLQDVPPWQLSTALSHEHRYENLLAGHRFQYTYSHKEKEAVTGDVAAESYYFIDYFFYLKWRENYKLTFSVTNITNEKIRPFYQLDGVYSPGRSFNIGFHARF